MTRAISEIIDSWPIDLPFSARTAISMSSHAVTDDHLFELAIEECLDAIDREGTVEIHDFVLRFPEIKNRLLPYLSMTPQCVDKGWPRVGEELEGHKILQILSLSDCSRVYLAEDERAGGRATVIKINTEQTCEAIYLSRMSHPSVCTLYQSSEDAKRIHLRYVEGANGSSSLASLNHALHGGLPIPFLSLEYRQRITIAMGGIASAVMHIHSRGVAHNDIRPSNIVLGKSGAVLIDFDAASEIGVHGAIRSVGTVEYLSNESLEELACNGQIVCQNCIHDDYFAFAVTCYEMLTGNVPWSRSQGEVTAALCRSILEERKCLSVNNIEPDAMPLELRRVFINVFNSAISPVSPPEISRLLRMHLGTNYLSSEPLQAEEHHRRDADSTNTKDFRNENGKTSVRQLLHSRIRLSLVSVVAFTILVIIIIPADNKKDVQPLLQASPTAPLHSTYSQLDGIGITPTPSDSTKSPALSADGVLSRNATTVDHREQIELYENAINNSEASGAIWCNYGYSLLCVRRPVEARKAFLKAIHLDPSLSQPYFHLAVLDEVCHGKYGAAPCGVSALAALQHTPGDSVVRRLASTALASLSALKNANDETRETARLITELLNKSREVPPSAPLSPIVNPDSPERTEFVQGDNTNRK